MTGGRGTGAHSVNLLLLMTLPAVVPPSDFVAAVRDVQPAVVSVHTEKYRRAGVADSAGAPVVPSEGVGSGVVFDTLGHIVTCDHVVAGYSEISVTFAGGTTLTTPNVLLVGRDPMTDIAVLRVSGTHRLTAARFADSDSLAVGQPVLALGSPFGLENTVTSGIVSAIGRWGFKKGSSGADFQSFVQTDATINPGNSGGPLVDIQGRVVGINSFIRTRKSGFTSIGFAVPSNVAADVARQLIARGRVVRGYLGVSTQAVTDPLRRALELPSAMGVLIAQVSPGGPGDRAGLKPGDVIGTFEGEAIEDLRAFQTDVAALAPGTTVRFGVIRRGRRLDLAVVLAEWPAMPQDRPSMPVLKYWLGMRAADIPQRDRERGGLQAGIVVTEVEPTGPAADAGIAATDIILELAGVAVSHVGDLDAIRTRLSGSVDPILVRVLRGRQTFYTAILP